MALVALVSMALVVLGVTAIVHASGIAGIAVGAVAVGFFLVCAAVLLSRATVADCLITLDSEGVTLPARLVGQRSLRWSEIEAITVGSSVVTGRRGQSLRVIARPGVRKRLFVSAPLLLLESPSVWLPGVTELTPSGVRVDTDVMLGS